MLMTKIGDKLLETASEVAEYAQTQISQIDEKLAQIEHQKIELEAERTKIRGALQRAADFPVTRGADYLCPLCWVDEAKESTLRPVPSGNRDDIFRCNSCHYETVIPG